MKLLKIAMTVLLSCAGAASATTVTFDVEVTQSNFSPPAGPGAPTATLPALGTMGMVTLSLPGITSADMTPIGDPDNPPNAGSVTASISIGSLSASLEPGSGSVAFASDTLLRFANGSFSSIGVSFPRDAGATPTYAGSFLVESDADGVTPTTFGQVIDAITSPSARMIFSFNGTTFDGIDTSFRAESIAPVPLPAGGLLVLTGLGAMVALRRRGRSV